MKPDSKRNQYYDDGTQTDALCKKSKASASNQTYGLLWVLWWVDGSHTVTQIIFSEEDFQRDVKVLEERECKKRKNG